MQFLLNAHQTRRTAALLLFVWLMSLGIGMVNACLLPQNDYGHELLSHGGSGFASEAFEEYDVALGKVENIQVKSDANDPPPAKTMCLDFCTAAQSTLVKHHADALIAQDLFPVLYLTWLPVPALDQNAQPEAFGRPTWSEPPVSIRYLRLTI